MAIDKQKLLNALNESDPEVQWFADLKLQNVRALSLKDPQGIERFRREMAADAKRFVQVPKRTSRERYAELEGFIKVVSDPALQKRLREALQSPSPQREFRLALERKAKEQRQFEAYLQECSLKRLREFQSLNYLG